MSDIPEHLRPVNGSLTRDQALNAEFWWKCRYPIALHLLADWIAFCAANGNYSPDPRQVWAEFCTKHWEGFDISALI